MNKISLFLLLAMLAGAAFAAAACQQASVTVPVVAVVGNGGSVLGLQVESRPGNGDIYSATSPRIGVSTQQSEIDAANYAYALNNVSPDTCDLLFRVTGSSGDTLIDGPSAGAAMTLAVNAVLAGKAVRNDVVVTGTIEDGGIIGPVGGIIEKARAAAEAGKTAIITPKQQIYEHLVLSTLATRYNFTSVEAGNISDASAIVYAKAGTPVQGRFDLTSAPIPSNATGYPMDSQMTLFSSVSNSFIDRLQKSIDNLRITNSSPGELPALEGYFQSEIAKYRKEVALGYVYTGANDAFLTAVDAEFLRVGYREVDLEGSKNDVLSCTAALSRPSPNSNNMEWVAGGDLRSAWSAKKANETDVANVTGEDSYLALRELLFAQGWCDVANLIYVQAGSIDGKPLDESALAGLAEERIKAATDVAAVSGPDSDAAWHLDNAQQLYDSGEYAAAIYDATYASSMYKARSEVDGLGLANASANVMGYHATSLWGKIFESQARYIIAGHGMNFDAYRLLRYSQELDAAKQKMDAEIASGGTLSQPPVEKAAGANNANMAQGDKKTAAALAGAPVLDEPFAAVFLAVFWLLGIGIIWRGIGIIRERRGGQ